MSQEFTQIVYGLLGLGGIELDEGINVVECIEQEMGIDLAFEVLQFGFGFCLFELFAFVVELYPVNTHFDGDAQPCYQCKRKHVAENEGEEGWRLSSSAKRASVEVEAVDEFVRKVHEERQRSDEQQVDDDEFLGLATKKKFIDEVKVIDIENGHEAQQSGSGSPKIGPAEDVSSVEEK